MNAADVDGLPHAFQGHSKQKKSSDFKVARHVDEDFSESGDLRFEKNLGSLAFSVIDYWRWDGQSTSLL